MNSESQPSPPRSAEPALRPGRPGDERSRNLALLAARTADALKCRDVVILELGKRSALASFFVMATGTTARQIRSVTEEIKKTVLSEMDSRPMHIEGLSAGNWVVMDYVDVLVHLFDEPSRQYYDLELLWGDSPRLEWRSPERIHRDEQEAAAGLLRPALNADEPSSSVPVVTENRNDSTAEPRPWQHNTADERFSNHAAISPATASDPDNGGLTGYELADGHEFADDVEFEDDDEFADDDEFEDDDEFADDDEFEDDDEQDDDEQDDDEQDDDEQDDDENETDESDKRSSNSRRRRGSR